MAGNTRGHLKEKFESIHRNFDWVGKHCDASLELIKEKHPQLKESIEALQKGTATLDELAMNIYAGI